MTSWFWLVGAVVLSLLPPLVKTVLGGTEEVVTMFLAVFSVAVAVGSGLAAWLSAGRIVILPTLIGAIGLGVFAIDLGWATYGTPLAIVPAGVGEVFGSSRGLRVMIDLAGLAISGGLYIVPTFAAVQAWAGADRRARVIAGVNVLNAAFMVGGTIVIAVLQAFHVSTPVLFMLIGLATLGVAVADRAAPCRPARCMDFLSILFRALYRVELKGVENLNNAGHNPIIALNHTSFLDAALALSLLPKDPVFAIDSAMAQHWWVKPFLRFTRAMPLDPTKPMATRTLINAVKAGEPLIIFPEGRITVTGSLMKIYDGAGLIADKTDAFVVPVRLEGLDATPFTRLHRGQIRRRWFPKVTVTVLEPVKLTVDPALKGKHRRQAAGAALYEIMSNLVYRTTSIERTVPEALIEAAELHGMGRVAVEDPIAGTLTYRKLLMGARILGEKLMPLAPEGKPIGLMLPNANGAAVTLMALMSAGRVPAMINFTAGVANVLAACRAAKVDTILTSRAFIEKGRLDNLIAGLQKEVKIVYLDDIRPTITHDRQAARLLELQEAAGAAQARRLGGDPVHLGLGGHAEGRGAVPPQHAGQRRAGRGAHRLRPPGQGVQRAAGVPLVRADGRPGAAARLRRPHLSLSVAAALPHRAGAGVRRERHHPVRHRHLPQRLCARRARLRLPLAALHPGRRRAGEGIDAARLSGKVRPAHPRRLRRHRDRAGAGAQHADVQQVRHGRAAAARHAGAAGEGRGRRRGRPAVREGAERDGSAICAPKIPACSSRRRRAGTTPATSSPSTSRASSPSRAAPSASPRSRGEMISFAAVEALAGELWPDALSAVASVPDARKGERLILVTQKKDATRSEFQAFARSRGATEIMVPAEIVYMEKMPLLGTGKIDNMAVTKLVKERFAAAPAARRPRLGA